MSEYLIPVLSMGAIGAILATMLVVADSRLKVEEDPRITDIHELLPGADCGACGSPGCRHFAEQVAIGGIEPGGCMAGGPEVAGEIGRILGVDVEIGVRLKARVMCLGGRAECPRRALYTGLRDCRAAAMVGGGEKSCVYGCLGYGGCVAACPFGAMRMDENGLPVIIDHCCTGCGLCVAACPRDLIELVGEDHKLVVGCSSPERGKAVKQICSRGCIGCSLCVKVCPVEAIVMVNDLPVVDQNKCDGCGVCIEKCPTDSLLRAEICLVPVVNK